MDLLLQVIIQGVLIGSLYAVIALGMAIVYNATNVLNFAHGDFMVLAMFLGLTFFTIFGLDPYISVFITFPIMFFLGILIYQYIIRRILDKEHLMVIQLTLGLLFIIQSSLLMIYGGSYQRVPSAIQSSVIPIGDIITIRAGLLVAFIVSVLLSLVLWWVLKTTDFGRSVRAISQDRTAAALMGINVQRVQMLTFGIGIAIVSIAGTMLLPITTIHPSMGLHYTVITLIIIVLGSMGNFAGTLIGGILIGLVESIGTVYISGELGIMLPYLLFVIILLFRPQGLLGGQ